MIIRFEQTERLPERKHQILDLQGKILGTGGVPDIFNGYFSYNGSDYSAITQNISTAIFIKNGAEIGSITQCLEVTKKILFLKTGYEYYKVLNDQNRYLLFESGLGKNKHFYSLYLSGNVVGVIHKDDLVQNYKNTYTLYAISDSVMLVLLLCTIFLESTAYCDRSSAVGNMYDNTPYYTRQKELTEKYDPTFIPRIKAMDGITDQV